MMVKPSTKRTSVIAPVLLMAALMCGCDDVSSTSDDPKPEDVLGGAGYCALIKEHLKDFQNFDFGGASGESFADLQAAVDEIEVRAPANVKEQWATFGDGLDAFAEIFEKAGLSVDDLDQISAGTIPDGVDAGALMQLQEDLVAFASNNAFQESLEGLPQAVKKKCGVAIDKVRTDGDSS